ncbi:MAG: hypothetical protein KAS11_02620 [Candidatus Aenigmarchaeota archaeon]|nr:hypothetical protein [Candidatus Aenigmarchaeota archaeon]
MCVITEFFEDCLSEDAGDCPLSGGNILSISFFTAAIKEEGEPAARLIVIAVWDVSCGIISGRRVVSAG